MKLMTLPTGRDKKIVIGGFFLFLLLLMGNIVVFWYVGQLIAPPLPPNQLNLPSFKETSVAVAFALDPSEGQFSPNQEFPVTIILKSGGKAVIGADVILKYDPEKLVILKIIPGEVFDLYPQLEIKENKILISAINENQKTFTGQGILAQVKARGKKAGVAKLSFDFSPGQTADSNVALENSTLDGLEEVKNGSYTFIK